MWESAVKRYEDALVNKSIEQGVEKGILIDKKNIFIDQFTIKFGKSTTADPILG